MEQQKKLPWSKILLAVIFLATVLVVGWAFLSTPAKAHIEIADAELEVLTARTMAQKVKGLSGMELSELNADGMLFIYAEPRELTYWMKGMKFNLDIIWIKNNKVVKVQRTIAAPEEGEDPERMTSAPYEVDAVLELPAGMAQHYGIIAGQSVKGLD